MREEHSPQLFTGETSCVVLHWGGTVCLSSLSGLFLEVGLSLHVVGAFSSILISCWLLGSCLITLSLGVHCVEAEHVRGSVQDIDMHSP